MFIQPSVVSTALMTVFRFEPALVRQVTIQLPSSSVLIAFYLMSSDEPASDVR